MKRFSVCVLAVGVLWAESASGQAVQNIVLRNSFNPVGAGARGLGMGGAFIAVADDGTAASFNPAGLSQLRRTELALVGFTDTLESTVTVPKREGAETVTATDTHRRPDFVGVSVPFDLGGRSLTVQLSYQRAVDLFGSGAASVINEGQLSDIDPDLPPLKAEFIGEIRPRQEGAFHTFSVAAGYQTTTRLSFGASINYWKADWKAGGSSVFRLRVFRPGSERPTETPLFATEFEQDNGMSAVNLNLGFLLRYPRLSIGGVVRLPFGGDYNLVERNLQTDFINLDADGNASRSVSDFRVTSRLHWPRSAGVGIAVRPFKGFTLATDYARSEWSRTSIDDVPGGALLTPQRFEPDGTPRESFTTRNFFDLFPASLTETRDTAQWRAGFEYLFVTSKLVLPLRGGLYRDRSPIVELGSDRGREIKGFTLGTGINFKHVVLDVGFERRTSTGLVALRFSEEGTASGRGSTESVRETRVVASLIFRAGSDNDPLKRAFRYLFGGSGDENKN
jgi:long-subunit fatty acid transport protein